MLLARRAAASSALGATRALRTTPALRKAITIGDETAYAKALEGDGLKVVYFTASWCGPCKMISPIYDTLSDTHTSATFLKVDVDELAEVAAAASVTAMPTFQFLKGGKLLDKVVGADPVKLETFIKAHSAS